MYNSDIEQPEFVDFYLPFGGELSANNRWVKLAQMMPWDEVEACYCESLAQTGIGAPAKSARIAYGALIIKERLGITDEETTNQILENPHLQHFLGLSEYQETPVFDSSMMVHFRKKFTQEHHQRINSKVIAKATEKEEINQDSPPKSSDKPTHAGKLLVDATCTPADITYPTDLKLLNDAREKTEAYIDTLHTPNIGQKPKPRTYRRKARKDFLAPIKQKQPRAKISISHILGGYVTLGKLSWDAYNEGGDIAGQIEDYHQRLGYYPASVHADTIYRTRENRRYCKEKGIRLSGKPLGRPRKETAENKAQLKALKKQARQDELDRIPVESKFGIAKRKGTLERIMAKLSQTSESVIHVGIIVLNLDKWLREVLFCLFSPLERLLKQLILSPAFRLTA